MSPLVIFGAIVFIVIISIRQVNQYQRGVKFMFGKFMGIIGHLTQGLITREEYYLQSAVIALSELRYKDWY